jgi:hypothetical protein
MNILWEVSVKITYLNTMGRLKLESAGGYWNYSNLKGMEFNRKEYEEQLKIICGKLMEDGNSR